MLKKETYRVFQIDYRENADDAAEMMGGFQPEGSVSKGALKRLDMYVPVAVIPARNLDEVFVFGNHEGGEVLTVGQMHSVSVGDIIVDEADKASVVASGGFEEMASGAGRVLGNGLGLDAAQAIVFRHLRLAASDLDGMKASEAGQNVGGPYEFDGMQTDEY